MNDSVTLLEQIGWIIKPLSDFILFLFTTRAGYLIMLGFLGLYLILSVWNALRIRKLAITGANRGSNYIPFPDKIYIIGSELVKASLKIVSNVPVLLGVLLLMGLIVGMSASFNAVNHFLDNQQKIKELKTVLKHLDDRYKIAQITATNIDYEKYESSLEIKFFDNSINGFVNKDQLITIKGDDIYFDAAVINFKYSEIEAGNARNIVIPYRIYSNEVSQNQGIELQLADDKGIPFAFYKPDSEIYGITKEKYNERLSELFSYLKDSDKAREAGIRSAMGNAVHKKMKKGDVITIWVEQTGGLVIKSKDDF